MKTGLIQQHNTADRDGNILRLEAGIRKCAAAGAQLVVLQELHNSLYFCNAEDVRAFDLAETVPGPSTDRLCRLAQSTGVVIVASLFERRAPGVYHNTAAVIDADGSIAGTYRKMHIPDDPAYYEKFYFTPGDTGFRPVKTSVGTLGVLVCWDQWFPEAARIMALRGADILIYPTAIGWDATDTDGEKKRQQDAWLTVQRGHAIANGLHVVTVNRTGIEPPAPGQANGIHFWGHSFVCGPQGEMLAQFPDDGECIEIVDIDMSRTEQVRRWWPFLRDRRIDAFRDIERRMVED
jgi:N-carbamoylputrescine amidase